MARFTSRSSAAFIRFHMSPDMRTGTTPRGRCSVTNRPRVRQDRLPVQRVDRGSLRSLLLTLLICITREIHKYAFISRLDNLATDSAVTSSRLSAATAHRHERLSLAPTESGERLRVGHEIVRR